MKCKNRASKLAVAVAGMLFVLAPAARPATSNGTFNAFSHTNDMLNIVTLDGTEYPVGSLIGVAMNDPPSPPETWYRQRGWIPDGATYPATKESAYAMCSDGQLSTILNFLTWWDGSSSYQDYTFDSPVSVRPGSEVALLGEYWPTDGSMTFTALDSGGNPVPATTYTPAFAYNPSLKTLPIIGSDGFNAIWPWSHRWPAESHHSVFGAAMDFSPDDVSEIYGLRLTMGGSTRVSQLFINEMYAVPFPESPSGVVIVIR